MGRIEMCIRDRLYSELLMEETLPASAKANVEALYKQSEMCIRERVFYKVNQPHGVIINIHV